MEQAAEDILDILEEYECTVADGIALLEMVKFNLLTAGLEPTEGVTLQ
jgi:hypothetical protein